MTRFWCQNDEKSEIETKRETVILNNFRLKIPIFSKTPIFNLRVSQRLFQTTSDEHENWALG